MIREHRETKEIRDGVIVVDVKLHNHDGVYMVENHKDGKVYKDLGRSEAKSLYKKLVEDQRALLGDKKDPKEVISCCD